MNRQIVSFFLCLIVILSGCQDRPKTNSTQHDQLDVDLTRLSTSQYINQTYSNEAKENLKSNNDLTSIKAVNTEKDLLITFEVDHHKRFQLEKIRKDIEKKMKKKFSDLDVFVSTDQKIILELDEIEKDIQKNTISKKELNKKIEDLISLAKEET